MFDIEKSVILSGKINSEIVYVRKQLRAMKIILSVMSVVLVAVVIAIILLIV